MKKTFVARDEVDSNVTKAKDANMKESSEDWYPMDDPRNPVNMRRRGAKWRLVLSSLLALEARVLSRWN